MFTRSCSHLCATSTAGWIVESTGRLEYGVYSRRSRGVYSGLYHGVQRCISWRLERALLLTQS
eukprot:89144-Lingulodinium_polyedra.AAC.1